MLHFSSGSFSPSSGVPSKRIFPLSRMMNLSAIPMIFSSSCVRTIIVFPSSLSCFNIEQTVLTGFVVLLYYYVYRKASKFS